MSNIKQLFMKEFEGQIARRETELFGQDETINVGGRLLTLGEYDHVSADAEEPVEEDAQ